MLKSYLFLVSLGLVSSAVITSSHGIDRNPSCFQGPEYWCRDIRTAKECHAAKHCSQTVWPFIKLPEDNGDICQICKEMVQEARDQLLSNETQDELRQVFEGTCILIPVKAIKKECIKLADEFVPELVDMLASQMNPQMVCASAGLCNSERINKMWEEYKSGKAVVTKEEKSVISVKNPVPGGCDDCRRVIDDVKTIMETHSKEEVLERLLYICDQIGGFSDICKMEVTQNFPEIYKILSYDLDSQMLCEVVGMCDAQVAGVQIKPKGETSLGRKIDDNTECEFCEAMVRHVREMANTSTTEEEFLQIVEGLCHFTKMEDKCLAFVHRYYRAIYVFIINEMQPLELCSAIGLCKKGRILDRPMWIPVLADAPEQKKALSEILSPKAVLPLVKLEPARPAQKTPLVKMTAAEPAVPYEKEDVQELLSLFPAGLVGKDEEQDLKYLGNDEVKNKPFCALCELVMHEIQTILSDTNEDRKIEDAVRKVCKRMPSSLTNECEDFILEYGDAVLFMLSQQLDAAKVCPALNMCLEAELSNDIETFPEWTLKRDPRIDPNCAFCHLAVKELENRIRENRTEESIKHELESLCSRLPGTLRDECDDFVDTYAPRVIDLVLNRYTPDQICVYLQQCKPKEEEGITLGEFLEKVNPSKQAPKTLGEFLEEVSKTAEKIEVVAPSQAKELDVSNNPLCVMCEYAMAKIDRMLVTNATEEDIRKAVRNVCYVLPKTVELQCFSFLDQYGTNVIDLLLKQLAPEAVCSSMGVCLKPHEDDVSVHMNRCEICEVAVEYFDTLLEDDTVEENIDQILEKVCAIIPVKNRPQCKAIIDTYGPYIVSLIGQLANSHEVCRAIDLCNDVGAVRMFGGEQCNLGPAYWCSSEKHANACKQTEYCQKSVWKSD